MNGSGSSRPVRRVAYVVRSWPRLSQTFIVNEVSGLEQLGVEVSVFSITSTDEQLAAAGSASVRAPVRYLDRARRRTLGTQIAEHVSLLAAAPRRYLSTLAFSVRGRQLTGGYATATRRDCFRDAVHVAAAARRQAAEGRSIDRIHAHFAHDPALVGLLAHRLSGIPYSMTAHARDLYGVPVAALEARVRDAAAVVTCCRANADYIRAVIGDDRLHLVHHGVDLERFRPAPENGDGDVPLVLSVGRLVEKKGFPDLLRACAVLRERGHRFRCEIYGEGPLAAGLEELRDRLGLAGVVRFCGPIAHTELIPVFQTAAVFALTPVVAADGDRDGLPNVLVEAMACGVPVVTTAVGGTPDLVHNGENGLVISPGDVGAVADQIGDLLADTRRRHALGTAARRTVEAHFDARVAARRMASLFAGNGGPR